MTLWISTGFQPLLAKKSGPSRGANFNGAPAWSRGAPIFFANIFKSAGEARSMTQC